MKHQTISFIKSGIRIAGYLCLALPYATPRIVSWGVIVLIISEIVGIVEELGHE